MHKSLSQWFIPHTSNNYRAKLLHHSSILFFIIAFFLGQFVFTYLRTDYPAVLGSSIDLSTEQLVQLTNQQRQKEHVQPLKLNDSLSQAAAMKADFMFSKNFWAHNGPDGTTPWYFFKQVGYNYTYAGENLARGFTNSSEVMNAWMNSPTHRENILSPNYEEIGFAIKKGRLLDEDTTLIVELFGTTNIMPLAKAPEKEAFISSQKQQVLPAAVEKSQSVLKTTSLLSSRILSSSIALSVLFAFLFGLFLDLIIIHRKKITRVVGHNIDHIFFFIALIIVMIISTNGIVL